MYIYTAYIYIYKIYEPESNLYIQTGEPYVRGSFMNCYLDKIDLTQKYSILFLVLGPWVGNRLSLGKPLP